MVEVIPLDGSRPTRLRGAASAGETLAAGAARAGGERDRRRRRTTPLLAGLDGDRGQQPDHGPGAAPELPATRKVAPAPARKGPPPAPARKGPPPAPASGLSGDRDRLAELVGAAAQVGGWIAEILAANLAPALAEQKLASALEFLVRRLTGEYQVDEFGFDPDLTDAVLLALARPLYRHWFRVEVRGIENIPATGGALVVANHSGAVALDSVMTAVAVHDEHPQHRFLRLLGADLVFDTPLISQLARKGGATLASNADAERLLSGGEVVGVWPEGFKGIGKPFSERYKLQRFGRGGFVSAALRTSTPIIPCSIVGAEEIYPIIGNLPSVARLLGLPYLPITPTFPWLGPLGAIPLPSKWLIEFGSPVPTDSLGGGAQDDPMLIFDLTDQVRQTIQQTLYTLLMQRRSIFY